MGRTIEEEGKEEDGICSNRRRRSFESIYVGLYTYIYLLVEIYTVEYMQIKFYVAMAAVSGI